jgi:hypothetical protein
LFSSANLLLLPANPRSRRAPSIDTPARREFADRARSPNITDHVVAYFYGAFPARPAGRLHPTMSAFPRRPSARGPRLAARGQARRIIGLKQGERVTLWTL